MRLICLAVGLFLVIPAASADELTPEEAAEGWLMLFDGKTTFGWETGKGVFINRDGELVLPFGENAGASTTAAFGPGELRLEYSQAGPGPTHARWAGGNGGLSVSPSGSMTNETFQIKGPGVKPISFHTTERSSLGLKRVLYKPAGMKPLFNGKDLTGWEVFKGDPRREQSKITVTADGELSIKDGPGDLRTERRFANFVLQLECKTNGQGLNSGVFFRCIPGQYQNGYEAQIHNAFNDGDRSKPKDFGTGGIYRRVPARKVVADDNEWFTLTVIADGPHIATWVNGYQTADWTDERKADENPRRGLRTDAGHISIQGHDPTTDLLFRNIRIAGLSVAKE